MDEGFIGGVGEAAVGVDVATQLGCVEYTAEAVGEGVEGVQDGGGGGGGVMADAVGQGETVGGAGGGDLRPIGGAVQTGQAEDAGGLSGGARAGEEGDGTGRVAEDGHRERMGVGSRITRGRGRE